MVGLYLVLPSDTKRGITAIRHLSTVKSQTIEQYAIWLRLAPRVRCGIFNFNFYISFGGLKDTPFAMYFVLFPGKEISDHLLRVQLLEIL